MRSNLPIKGESLAGVTLFADLDLEARQVIAEQCSGYEFAAEDVILNYKDTSREVYFVLSGDLQVSLISLNGKRITFSEKYAGDMVGELAAIDGQPRCAQVVATTASRVVAIEPDTFMKIVSTYPSVAQQLMKRLTSQVRELSERVFEFNALCVNNRIHVDLLRAANSGKADGKRRVIAPAPTHADIASRVSTHREAVTRELSRLTKQGMLKKHKDVLIVMDIDELSALVEQSLGGIPLVC